MENNIQSMKRARKITKSFLKNILKAEIELMVFIIVWKKKKKMWFWCDKREEFDY